MQPVAFREFGTLFLRRATSADSGRDLAVAVGTREADLFTILFRGRFTGLLYANGADETLRVVSSQWDRRFVPLLDSWVGEADPVTRLSGIRVVCDEERAHIEAP